MKFNLFLLLCLVSTLSFGQSVDYPLNHPAYSILDGVSVKSEDVFFSKIKPYSRKRGIEILQNENALESYLRLDSREWSGDSTKAKKSLGKFFHYSADLYTAEGNGFDLHVNPVVHSRVGSDSRSENTLYEFNRGIEVRALIDKKIGVYTMISENQSVFPDYINSYRDSLGAIPYEGFWKTTGTSGSDFFRADGYVDVGVTDHVSLQLGFGRHFIGDGQRSLILSDFSNRYPYVRIETEVWRLKYTNIFAQLVGEAAFGSTGNLGSSEFPQKFMTMHHLDLAITDNFNLGFFESVVFGEPDSLGGGVKLQYLNPVIFYRALEQQDGSPDNVIIGMDFNWRLWNRLSLYGQLVVDEMIVKEVFAGDGWWGNKQGFQLGAKYFDAFGIDGLQLQGEINAVRPYTYAHEDLYSNYSHYNMPLAHPLGANFRELIGKADYWISDKWRIQFVGLFATFGDDQNETNYGQDISVSYNDRPSEYGNEWLQGNRKNLISLNTRISRQFMPNLFVDVDYTLRELSEENRSSIFALAFRWNFPDRFYLF